MEALRDITVFDFETTGTCPRRNRVLEVAAIRYKDFQPVALFNTFVRFEEGVPASITNITGITSEQVADAMPERTALAVLRNLAAGSTLVAHNAGFDLSFLHFAGERLGAKEGINNPFLCTMTIARQRYPYPHKLGVCCERLGIKADGAHRALADVEMCFQLLKAMHEAAPVQPELLNTLGYIKRYGGPEWHPHYAKLLPQ